MERGIERQCAVRQQTVLLRISDPSIPNFFYHNTQNVPLQGLFPQNLAAAKFLPFAQNVLSGTAPRGGRPPPKGLRGRGARDFGKMTKRPRAQKPRPRKRGRGGKAENCFRCGWRSPARRGSCGAPARGWRRGRGSGTGGGQSGRDARPCACGWRRSWSGAGRSRC